MFGTIIGLGAPVLAAILHAFLVRWLPSNLRVASVPVLAVLTASLFAIGAAFACLPLSLGDLLLALVTAGSLGVAYGLLLLGVLYDSPTLALVNAIEACGRNGMPTESWDAVVRAHPFLQSRLQALIRTGVVAEQDGMLISRGGVDLLLALSAGYRRLCGRQSQAG